MNFENKLGTTGTCLKCGEIVNNVSFHESICDKCISNSKIICLSGFATSGKDTFFNLLSQNDTTPFIPSRFKRIAFADELKKTAAPYIKSLYNIDIFNCTPQEKEMARPILISIGCWARDNISDTYWVDKTIDQIKKNVYQGYIPTICDFRFSSEANKLIEVFGRENIVFVEIVRTDSNYNPPQKELENQPLLAQYIDYRVEWPTVGKDEIEKLNIYIEQFKNICIKK